MRTLDNLPRVVLAGCPNAGKSTLFNRLSHSRRAITSPVPGVTRDAVEADILLCGNLIRLVDTGGFRMERSHDIDELVVERTLETIKSADLVVLLFAAGGLSAEDEEFISLLRPMRNRLIACVNKTEGGRLLAESCNIASYGFDEIYFISAEHGDNVAELAEAIVRRLDFSSTRIKPNSENPEDGVIKIAVSGKPNTGKSTLCNRLRSCGASLVSDVPGTTRDVIEGSFLYKGREFVVLDTAGIRRKSKIVEDIEYYSINRALKSMEDADIVLLMIDAGEGLSVQDKKIAALSAERGRPVIFVLNKWDTMPQIKNAFNAARDRLRFFFPKMAYAPVAPLSAKTGEGLSELLGTVVKAAAQSRRKTETPAFNRMLETWQEQYPPPYGPKSRFKIKYGLQISQNPVVFKLFVSRPQAWTENYASYLINKIREEAGYSMVPVRLDIAPSRESGQRR